MVMKCNIVYVLVLEGLRAFIWFWKAPEDAMLGLQRIFFSFIPVPPPFF